MWYHPDVGTDSSCISASPCNSSLLLSFAQWDLGLFLLEGQASVRWQRDGARGEVFAQCSSLSTNTGHDDVPRTPSPAIGMEMGAYTSVFFEAN